MSYKISAKHNVPSGSRGKLIVLILLFLNTVAILYSRPGWILFIFVVRSLLQFRVRITGVILVNFQINYFSYKGGSIETIHSSVDWVGYHLRFFDMLSNSGQQPFCIDSLAYKTRFHLIFRFPAWSKRNIILTVTAQSNQFLHSRLSTDNLQVETSKNWNTWNKYWKYPKIEQFEFSLQYDV